MDKKRKVIVITDGDESARKAIEVAAKEVGGRCITNSWGNPTRLTGMEIVNLIKKAYCDPVLVMFDDCGFPEEGPGEQALRYVATHEDIQVIGAIAVASKTHASEWTRVDVSIDKNGYLTEYGVDKYGLADIEIGRINGDTVYNLNQLGIPFIVGVGDIGKMSGKDDVDKGAPITIKAVQLILERSGKL